MKAWKSIGIWLAIVGLILVIRVLWNIPLSHEDIAAVGTSGDLDGLDLFLGLAMIVIGIFLFHLARRQII